MRQSRDSFLNVWENTEVTRAITDNQRVILYHALTSQSFSRWDKYIYYILHEYRSSNDINIAMYSKGFCSFGLPMGNRENEYNYIQFKLNLGKQNLTFCILINLCQVALVMFGIHCYICSFVTTNLFSCTLCMYNDNVQ